MNEDFKPSLFKNLTAGERSEINLIEAHLNHYKQKTAEGENHPEYKQYLKQAKTIAERESKREASRDLYVKLVEDNDIYHVAKNDKLYMKTAGTEMYQEFPIHGLCRALGIRTDNDNLNLLMEALRKSKRAKHVTTVSFGQVRNNQLNLLGSPEFLEPSDRYDDEDKFWYDLLLDSVSGSNQGVRDQIESSIAYKYLHPETFELPMWLPYGKGSGGAGKNVFVTGPIASIWGNAVSVTNREGVLGQWTGGMLGKMFIMIDENVNAQNDFNSLKSVIGNERIDVNFKNGQKLSDMPNTAMYMMTCNLATCPIKLTDTAVDRRFSVWQIRKDIIENLAERLGEQYNKDDSDPIKKKLLEMFAANKYRYKDQDAAAGWLGEIISKWGHLKSAPAPYRGEEYRDAVEEGKGPLEASYEDVFGWPRFKYISLETLYERYKALVKAQTPSASPKLYRNYIGEVRAAVEMNYPNIVFKKTSIYDTQESRYISTNVFILKEDADKRERKPCNENKFIGTFGEAKTLWIDEPGETKVKTTRQQLLDVFQSNG